jgi:uncharacterized membrane protein YdjX (TVP38/TMEM64 family)
MSGPAVLRLVLSATAVLAVGVAVAALGPHSPAALQDTVDGLGLLAPLALVAGWGVLTPALFPGTILATAGGVALGAVPGVAVSVVGATLGAGAAFALARLAGPQIAPAGADAGRLRRLQARVECRPVLAVALLRAAPGMPATLLNYAVGLSRVRPRHFLVGVTLGGAPRVAAYALLGAGLADPAAAAPALAVGGGVLVAGALAGILWRARRPRPV